MLSASSCDHILLQKKNFGPNVIYYLWGTLDKPRQVTKIYEFYVPVSALALGGRTKKHEFSYPRANCQKKSGQVTKKHGGQFDKKYGTGMPIILLKTARCYGHVLRVF